MSASDAFESDLLKLIFQNTGIANIGDATGLLPAGAVGNLYVALHTADPTDAGNQSSNETTYTGYVREPVVRSSAGWTVSGTSPTQVANAAVITFPASTVGTPTITHFSVGYQISGATKIVASGALTNPQVINLGGLNTFAIGALVVTCD